MAANGVEEEMSEKLLNELVGHYSAKGRFYHNLEHIEGMLQLASQFKEDIEDLQTLQFSIWYHDVIYNVKRKNNEEKSALLAQQRLSQINYPEKLIQKCHAQIIATKNHNVSTDSTDPDLKYLLDFDLAILGSEPFIYKEYTQNVREEYSIYPGFLYRRGRKKVLHQMLEQDWIYQTTIFRENFEKLARVNIRDELDHLK